MAVRGSLLAKSELEIKAKKQKALSLFIEKLLKTEAKGSIARIILFGSLLKGEAKEVGMATGESVESLIRCVDEARYPQSYFLYYNLKREREVYSMDVEGLKRKEAQNYLKLASEYLDGSRANCQKGYFRIAVDAAYNACELIVKGLLRLPDIPSSRGGLSTSLENYL